MSTPANRAIQHLVVLMMENRSFDHYLGALTLSPESRTDVEGLPTPLPTCPDLAGGPTSAFNLDGVFDGYLDPPHDPASQVANWNNGANDGFVKSYQNGLAQAAANNQTPRVARPDIPMGYYTRATLPVLYALTDKFTVLDHWFSSNLSSTWPNRKYLLSGCRDDDNDTHLVPGFFGFKTMPFLNPFEDARDPESGAPLTWRSYFSDLPFMAFWYRFAASHLSNFSLIDTFVDDCRENRLPTLSFIDPPFGLADDHPAYNVQVGQKFLGLVVDALTHSDSWQNTALMLIYDENGGFYDHVAPPASFEAQNGIDEPQQASCTLDGNLGFRVPALLISPFSGRGVVPTDFDHTSLMKSVWERWGVPFAPAVYGPRWSFAPSIWDSFNFGADPLPTGTYTQTGAGLPVTAALTWEKGVHDLVTAPSGGVQDLLERVFVLPELKALDKRASVFDSLGRLEQEVIRLKRTHNLGF